MLRLLVTCSYSVALICCLSAAAVAEAPSVTADAVISVWPDSPPAWDVPAEPEQDVTKQDGRGVAGKRVVRLKYVSKPELHVYRAKGKESATTILINPGGGYQILAWDLEGTEIARWLQGIGVNAIVVKYRVPSAKSTPEHWKPAVQDIQRAVSLVRSGAVKGVSGQRIGVLGFSAGGNASARVATASNRYYEAIDDADTSNVKPDFAVLIYAAWLNAAESQHKLSDDFPVTKDTVPMFLAAAQNDKKYVMSSVTMFRALTDNGVPASLHVFDNGGHGFGGRIAGFSSDAWRGLCETWMRSQGYLGDKP